MLTWLNCSDTFPRWTWRIFYEGIYEDGESVDWGTIVRTTHWHLSGVLEIERLFLCNVKLLTATMFNDNLIFIYMSPKPISS